MAGGPRLLGTAPKQRTSLEAVRQEPATEMQEEQQLFPQKQETFLPQLLSHTAQGVCLLHSTSREHLHLDLRAA